MQRHTDWGSWIPDDVNDRCDLDLTNCRPSTAPPGADAQIKG